jgi:hypothetical protein
VQRHSADRPHLYATSTTTAAANMGKSQGQQEKIPSKKRKIQIAKQNKTEVEFVNKVFPFIVAAMVAAFLVAIVLLFIKASAGAPDAAKTLLEGAADQAAAAAGAAVGLD